MAVHGLPPVVTEWLKNSHAPVEVQVPANSIPPFRGRCRIGRGGRVIFDRRPPVKTNGIVPFFEGDDEYNPRIHSLVDYFQSGFHPSSIPQIDPEKLLKRLEARALFEQEKKKKHPR